jgi:hypothetical protein
VLGTSTLLALLLSVPLLMLAGVDHVETRSALEQALALGLIIAFVLVARTYSRSLRTRICSPASPLRSPT